MSSTLVGAKPEFLHAIRFLPIERVKMISLELNAMPLSRPLLSQRRESIGACLPRRAMALSLLFDLP